MVTIPVRHISIKPRDAERDGNAQRDEAPSQSSPLVASVAYVAPPAPPNWPELHPDALYGLAGEAVSIIGPHSETDPVAALVQLLAAFGNRIGRSPHFRVESTRHHANEFVALIGESSKARKGTSWERVRALMTLADDEDKTWVGQCIHSGLLSGEGLLTRLARETDKRLLVMESELAQVLIVATRQGNILSPMIRQGWDGGTLELMGVKTCKRISDVHMSLVGHSTITDIRKNLTHTDAASGFGNRYLWCCVRRSKYLPDGGNLSDKELLPLAERLRCAIRFAEQCGEMQRDEQAREFWHAMYCELSEGKPGLVGALTGRAEAHVLRLSMINALRDQSKVIGVQHLAAAYALWMYCSDSVQFIFGNQPVTIADQILYALKCRSEGMTRTEIRDLFNRHATERGIREALDELRRAKLAKRTFEKTGGRPVERWFALATKAT